VQKAGIEKCRIPDKIGEKQNVAFISGCSSYLQVYICMNIYCVFLHFSNTCRVECTHKDDFYVCGYGDGYVDD
jgi:hypothetical protein